jgi:hypothetical protein
MFNHCLQFFSTPTAGALFSMVLKCLGVTLQSGEDPAAAICEYFSGPAGRDTLIIFDEADALGLLDMNQQIYFMHTLRNIKQTSCR